jgi:hypothetical protein
MVWGDAEVSERFPENISPIPRGDYLQMSSKRNGSVRIVFLKDPTDFHSEKNGMPPFSFAELSDPTGELLMARNETENMFFAAINETDEIVRLPMAAVSSSESVKAELLIGGVVRVRPPKYRLTKKQLFDLQMTGEEPEGAFDERGLGVVPFFAAGETPEKNFAVRYLANPEQVASFPGAVEVRPGEGAVMMLRVKTCGAPAGGCAISVRAGKARRELRLRVVDAVLPESSAWIFAWGQFTRQFPFESLSRVARDARQLRELGITMFQGLPKKGGKVIRAAEGLDRGKAFYRVYGVPKELVDKTYRTKGEKLTDADRAKIDAHLAGIRAEAEEL